MKTEILPVSEIQTALEILQRGGLVAFPTDTVYGVGALAFDDNAIKSIYAAKDRPIEKAIPVLIADLSDLDQVAEWIPEAARILSGRFWPGALTITLPKKDALPPSISSSPTVAVRIPDNADARSLLRAAGPMAVTSANISGQASPTSAEEVFAQLNGRIPLILDGGKTRGGVPSTLVECTEKNIEILREGPISRDEILAAIKNAG
jgi:L-threonylcarbamoyladenylate synthase